MLGSREKKRSRDQGKSLGEAGMIVFLPHRGTDAGIVNPHRVAHLHPGVNVIPIHPLLLVVPAPLIPVVDLYPLPLLVDE